MKKSSMIIYPATFLMLLLMLTSCVSAAEIYVNSGESIQSAIDSANAGDTIIVARGLYKENLDIDKELTIESESGNPDDTIIQAKSATDHVFYVTSDNVNISGFTAEGAKMWGKAGIYLCGVKNCLLFNNKAVDNGNGIYLENADYNNLSNNVANLNIKYGLYLNRESSYNKLRNNSASQNEYNFGFSENNYWVSCNNDIDISNTVEGKAIYNLQDVSDLCIDASSNAGTIYISNCKNISISDLNISNNLYGIRFHHCQDITISNVNASYNDVGIYLYESDENSLNGNTVNNNTYGIQLGSSDKNYLSNNIVCGNKQVGINIGYSSNNFLINNKANSNKYGIMVGGNNNYLENNVANSNNRGISISNSYNIVKSNMANINTEFGIYISDPYNTIYNNIANSKWGLRIGSSDNILYNNYISSIYPYSNSANNIWHTLDEITYSYNNTTHSSYVGNYYMDYTGLDSDGDGIGDTPYKDDDYPIVFWPFPVEEELLTPEAAFYANVTSGDAPLSVLFTDISLGATAWEWDVDCDGNVDSTEQNFAHTYENRGTYDVSLTVFNGNGSDTTVKDGYIRVSGEEGGEEGWVPWSSPESDGGCRITTVELQEIIRYWLEDLPAPWDGS